MGVKTPSSLDRITQRERFYKIIKNGIRKERYHYSLEASRMRIRLITNLLKKAYDKDSRVVYRNPFAPTEIFYALGMVPICLEAFSSMVAGTNLCSTGLRTADDNNYSRDTCSFLRCVLGSSIEDCLPSPDFLVCTSHYCDAGSKVFEILARRYKKDYFFLNTPYNYNSETAVGYLAGQVEEMANTMAEKVNKKLSLDKLAETIELSNQAREYFLKANELRQYIPAPIRGREAIDFAAIVAYTWGCREIVDVYKRFYEELRWRVENHVSGIQGESYRILWRHLRPYHNNLVMDYLETQHGIIIAFEEINYVHWGKMDPTDPYRSLARKILSNSVLGNLEHWLDATLDMIKTYNINGVISFSHWGCRTLNSANQVLKDSLKKINIPYLDLNGDCIDGNHYSPEQLKTRIDAFLEILGRQSPLYLKPEVVQPGNPTILP